MQFIKGQNAHNFEDLSGRKFERLYVESRAENSKSGNARWNCVCECDKRTIVAGSKLKNGTTKSCGCFRAGKTHGMSKSKIYKTYIDMLSRCKNIESHYYHNYFERGIKICECISNFEAFYNYVSKLEHYAEIGYSLDRINNDGNYCICKNNLRWATSSTQLHNQRIRKDNKSGIKGVSYDKKTNKWYVSIRINGKTKYLGRYFDIQIASNVRKQAEIKYLE